MKEKKTRIYVVPAEPKAGTGEHAKHYLVEASSGSSAKKHVAKKYVGDAYLPNGKEIAERMAAGAKAEQATEEEQGAAT